MSTDGWDLVVSYGDLSRSSGYRTRVMGELQHLDPLSGLHTFLLLFDRNPEGFTMPAGVDTPFRSVGRSSMHRFYAEVARLRRLRPIRIVHAHNLYSAALALSARRLHSYRVILDYHGRIPEEYVYLGKGGGASRAVLERLESWVARNADHVLVVSGMLRDYLEDRYRIPPERISVVPCATDSTAFRCDPGLRIEARRRLGVTERFVCIHLGSFFEWYDPDLLIRAFRDVLASMPQAFLLVVTTEVTAAREFVAAHLPEGTFHVMRAAHNEVPALLNASDLGFLLLRPSPNIRTSSPVKFAEYLNCGLPVAITKDVGDYTEFVQARSLGYVLESGGSLALQHGAPRDEWASRCAAAGSSLTWTSQAAAWKDAVDRVMNLGE